MSEQNQELIITNSKVSSIIKHKDNKKGKHKVNFQEEPVSLDESITEKKLETLVVSHQELTQTMLDNDTYQTPSPSSVSSQGLTFDKQFLDLIKSAIIIKSWFVSSNDKVDNKIKRIKIDKTVGDRLEKVFTDFEGSEVLIEESLTSVVFKLPNISTSISLSLDDVTNNDLFKLLQTKLNFLNPIRGLNGPEYGLHSESASFASLRNFNYSYINESIPIASDAEEFNAFQDNNFDIIMSKVDLSVTDYTKIKMVLESETVYRYNVVVPYGQSYYEKGLIILNKQPCEQAMKIAYGKTELKLIREQLQSEIVDNMCHDYYANQFIGEVPVTLAIYIYAHFNEYVSDDQFKLYKCPNCFSLTLCLTTKIGCNMIGCQSRLKTKSKDNLVVFRGWVSRLNSTLPCSSGKPSIAEQVNNHYDSFQEFDLQYDEQFQLMKDSIDFRMSKSGTFSILKTDGLKGRAENIPTVLLAFKKQPSKYILLTRGIVDQTNFTIEFYDSANNGYSVFNSGSEEVRFLNLIQNVKIDMSTLVTLIKEEKSLDSEIDRLFSLKSQVFHSSMSQFDILNTLKKSKSSDIDSVFRRVMALNLLYKALEPGALPRNECGHLSKMLVEFNQVCATSSVKTIGNEIQKIIGNTPGMDDDELEEMSVLFSRANHQTNIARSLKINNAVDLTQFITEDPDFYKCEICDISFKDLLGHVLTESHVGSTNKFNFRKRSRMDDIFKTKNQVDESSSVFQDYLEKTKSVIGRVCVLCSSTMINGTCPDSINHQTNTIRVFDHRVEHYISADHFKSAIIGSSTNDKGQIQQSLPNNPKMSLRQTANTLRYQKIANKAMEEHFPILTGDVNTQLFGSNQDNRNKRNVIKSGDDDTRSIFSTTSRMTNVKLPVRDISLESYEIGQDGKATYSEPSFNKFVHDFCKSHAHMSFPVNQLMSVKEVLYWSMGLHPESDDSVYQYLSKELRRWNDQSSSKLFNVFRISAMEKMPLFSMKNEMYKQFRMLVLNYKSQTVPFNKMLELDSKPTLCDQFIINHISDMKKKKHNDFITVEDVKQDLYDTSKRYNGPKSEAFKDALLLLRIRSKFNIKGRKYSENFLKFYNFQKMDQTPSQI